MLATLLERARKAREDESGFTLIELLIVIVILGILAGIVVFSVSGITDRGTTSACTTEVKTVQTAAEAAYAQTSNYPASLAALAAGGYLDSAPTNIDAGSGKSAGYFISYTVNAGPPASVTVTGTLDPGGTPGAAC
jgi:general secretion pathway protein G